MATKKIYSIKNPLIWTIIFVTFWSTITGVFDVIIYNNFTNQKAALTFPTTTGKVLNSKVESERDSDGTTYRAEIQFEYSVNNQAYTSDTYRFGTMGMSDSTEANNIVREFPVGANVTVYYDPTDPQRAILKPGVSDSDRFMLLFLTPFNLIGLAGWSLIIQMLYIIIVKPVAGGISIRRKQTTADGKPANIVQVRLPRIPPILAAALGGGVVCFISIFIGGFFYAMAPPLGFIQIVWGIALVVAVAVFIWRSLVVGSGIKDLIIDHENKILDLPQTIGRTSPVLIPFDAIKDIKLKRVVSYSSEKKSETWAPTLVLKPGYDFQDEVEKNEYRTKITEMMFAYKAQALVNWLRTELALDNR